MIEPRSVQLSNRDGLLPGPDASASGAESFRMLLCAAIDSSAQSDHALLVLNLDEGPRCSREGSLCPGEAETVIPQLLEIVRGADMLARVAQGRYAILLHDCTMAQMTRKIAAIDYLRGCATDDHKGGQCTMPIGTTYLRPDDTPEQAIRRARVKLERYR